MTDDLPGARRHLADAAATLCDPQPRTLDTGQRTYLDPLYRQLKDAVSGQTGPRSGTTSHLPIWADCFDLLTTIDTETRKWASDRFPATDTITRLLAITEANWRPQDATQLQQWATRIDTWTAKADQLLNPTPVVYLPDPCPACGATHTQTVIAGETGHQHTLAIRADGARCNHCERTWQTVPELRILGRMLGYHPHQHIA